MLRLSILLVCLFPVTLAQNWTYPERMKKWDELMRSLNDSLLELVWTTLQWRLIAGGGATYVRWGRTVCPQDAQLIYKGWAGGSHQKDPGAAYDYLCMPEQPQYLGDIRPPGRDSGAVYGAQYATDDRVWKNHKQDVPCALCYHPHHGVAFMVPTTYRCPKNITMAYRGYLMSGVWHHSAASEYVCVDEDAESAPNGLKGDFYSKFFFLLRSSCVGLTCPPYILDRVLTCVVCIY